MPSLPRLLLVEDHIPTHRALRGILERRGWEVLLATTVAEARALLDQTPSWVVLDLMLPDGDGTDVLREIRDRDLPIRVAVTTGAGDLARLRAIEGMQPEALMRKPIDVIELLRLIRQAC